MTILFFTKNVLAQSFYTTCTPLPTSPTALEVSNYNTCIANNRASAQSSGTAAAHSFALSGTTVVQPIGASTEQNEIYNKNLNINTTTAATALTAQQAEAVSITATTATGALDQIMRANTEGQNSYLITAESTLTEGLSKLSLAGECASVSSSACYSQRTELYATGAAYLLAQRQAEDQANQHDRARTAACIAKNQVSSTQEDCGSALDHALNNLSASVIASVSGITVVVNPGITSSPLSAINYDSLTGACNPPNAPTCINLSRTATPPSPKLQKDVREILKQKYAGTKPVTLPAQSLYSKNKDGSVSVKDGSVYSMNDFSDFSKLRSKGLSNTSVQNLLKNFNSIIGTAKSSSSTTATNITTAATEEASATAVITTTPAPLAVAPVQLEPDTEIEREPASLQIRLGSEFIGVAKDNIFKIINRRYKSEEKEDYFY